MSNPVATGAPRPRDDASVEESIPGPIPRYELRDWRERFGLVAGITGREADLGLWTASPVGQVMGHWRAFRGAEPGFDVVILGNQVHGANVAVHRSLPDARPAWMVVDGYDGHVTARPGVLLTVTVADCIPVYLAVPAQRAVALLHAGWRGTAGRILEAGLNRLLALSGATRSEVVMHCGPGICGPCYEVGSEVREGCGLPVEGQGPWHVDLRAVLAGQAAALGIESVTSSSWCTAHHRDRFHSHRASGGSDGRMVAYLGVPISSYD